MIVEIIKDRFDSDGNPVSLYSLVRSDPDWAASRIKWMEKEGEEMMAIYANKCKHGSDKNDGCRCDNKTAIKIGGGKTVEVAADAIIGILESTADQDTIRKALDTLA